MLLEALSPQHVKEGVVKGPQVGVHFALQIARQKPELLACLNGRPCNDDAVNLAVPKGCHR
ncbi:hypothetical protein SDC9_115414 [bioreactor metagenome]|uniref:Uncharacterized protein n=1 Tax=bioreactor metagenome TaxID=1076179 RepID=A0A645BV35_9ZZZZ